MTGTPAQGAAGPSAARTVVLLGAPGAGKTDLLTALLAAAGAGPRTGGPGELGHGLLHHRGVPLHLLDPPGHPDLAGTVTAAVRAASAAVLVLSPVQGLDPRTVALWHACEAERLPLLVVLTQLDRPGADADEATAVVQRLLGEAVVPLHLPLHDDDGAVAGLLDLLLLQVVDPSGAGLRDADPEHVRLVEPLRQDLLEAVLSGGAEDLFDAWLDDVEPGAAELARALPAALARGDLQPVLVTSPRQQVGLVQLLDLLVALPPAADRPPPAAETPGRDPVHLDLDGPPVAEVVRAHAPPLARVWSGPGTGDLVPAPAGLVPGAVLGSDVRLGPWPGPPAQLPVGVRPDEALARRVALDPSARLAVDARSAQLLLWTGGPEHAELLLQGLPSLPVLVEGPRTGTVRVRVPAWCARTVRSDATGRGGEVLAEHPDPAGEPGVVLDVRLPAAELVHYALALARASAATGSFERLTGPLT